VGVRPRAVLHSPFQISHITSVNDISWLLGHTGFREKKQAGNDERRFKKLSTEKKSYPQVISCKKLGLDYYNSMPNNNDLVNRPFADLQERLDSVSRLDRDDQITNRREVDYRAICDYLNSEIFHLIASVDDPKVKAWARKIVTNLHSMVGKDIL
jgi:hypothetical protein